MTQGYCKRGNFCVWVIFVFFTLLSSRENNPHAKKNHVFMNEIGVVSRKLPQGEMFSQHFIETTPAKITTFTVVWNFLQKPLLLACKSRYQKVAGSIPSALEVMKGVLLVNNKDL